VSVDILDGTLSLIALRRLVNRAPCDYVADLSRSQGAFNTLEVFGVLPDKLLTFFLRLTPSRLGSSQGRQMFIVPYPEALEAAEKDVLGIVEQRQKYPESVHESRASAPSSFPSAT
jgi:hypothetical protein